MKRFLSFAIVIVMLVGVLVTVVTAANALPTKGYLLTDYGQQHWFLGNEATKAPNVTDGTVGAMEYGFAVKGLKVTDMVNETYPNDNWTKTHDANFSPAAAPEDTFDLYASYDANNLYLAVVVHDSHWMDSMYHTEHGWLQGDEVYLDIGHYMSNPGNSGSMEMTRASQRIRFRMYSAGVDFYNASGGGSPYESVSRTNHQATKDVDGRAFYAATTSNGELANMKGVVNGYSFSSSVPVATGRGSAATVTYEISINKAAFRTCFSGSEFMNESPGLMYFAPLMKVVGVAGETANRANYGIGWYSLNGNDTTKFTNAFWANFGNKKITKIPQVMFLGQKSEYKTLLGNYYEECTEHTYRNVFASDTEYKLVCTKCGYEGAKRTLPTKPYLFSDFGQEHYFLGNEASYLPDVTDGKVSDREYTFVKKGIKVTDMINSSYGVWTKTNDANYNPAAEPEDTFDLYASYSKDMLYIAIVSHDSHWACAQYHTTHGWLQSDDVYLNVGHNPGVGWSNVYSHMRFNLYSNGVEYMNESGDGVLYSSASRLDHDETPNVKGGAYYLATEENGELGEDLGGVINAYSFSSDTPTSEGASGATLTYEIAIDFAAIRAKYGSGLSTDKEYIYFAPRMKVVGAKNSTQNRASYGSAIYTVNAKDTEVFTKEIKKNFSGWPTEIPHVIFFGEKSEFSTFLGDKYEACTHSYRYVLASETQHKQICELCGYVPTDEGTDHTYDNGVITRDPTNAKDGIKTYTCTACGITRTEAIDKLGPTNPENQGKNTYVIMGNNILEGSILEKGTPTTRFEQIMSAYAEYNPDIFGLQECDTYWHNVLDSDEGFVTLGYAQAVVGFGILKNPIYYKTDKFEVIDCGFTKYDVNNSYNYTWALFEVRETGEQFLVVCTHFTWADVDKSIDVAEARELIAGVTALETEYGVPAVIVGDFNSTMKEDAYKELAAAYSSARDCAKEKVNMGYSTMATPGKAGNAPAVGTFVLDHIFYTEDVVIGEKYEVFVDAMAYAYSDHMPQMLSFKLFFEVEEPEEPEAPEDIFELEGQKHTYVGVATTDAPVLSGDAFDASKYNEVADVDAENVKGNEGFIIGEGVNIGHFKIYMTYDDAKIYLAAEIGDKSFVGSESTTFTLQTLFGKADITLAATSELSDTKAIALGSKVFVSDNGSDGKIVVYALEIDRSKLMAIDTMATGDADSLNVAVVNNDDTGIAKYSVQSGDSTVGHTFTLSKDPSSELITNEGGSADIGINGAYKENEGVEAVVSVKLTWTIPVFTYTVENKWDTDSFDLIPVAGSGTWSSDPATIHVENCSNQDISASFGFATTISGSGINGKFTSDEAGLNVISSITLESAETNKAATFETVYFFITEGVLPDTHVNGGAIGNITITISGLGND